MGTGQSPSQDPTKRPVIPRLPQARCNNDGGRADPVGPLPKPSAEGRGCQDVRNGQDLLKRFHSPFWVKNVGISGWALGGFDLDYGFFFFFFSFFEREI